MWFRVFGTSEAEPAPAALLEHLQSLGHPVTGHFRGDDQGWFRADLIVAPETSPLQLERFLASEDDIRGELNTWAAWLELAEDNPNQERLMQHMMGTKQLFTFQMPDDGRREDLAAALCRHLAERTAGVYHVDGRGFFEPDGTPLVREE